jgi:hypothetical protein
MLGRREPEYGANGLGIAETGGNIDGGAISQGGHGANAGNGYKTAADLVTPDYRQQLTAQLGVLLAQLPPGLQQHLHEFAQIRQVLHDFPDARFEFGGADGANLKAEIAQQAAHIVVDGDGF